MRCTLVTPWRVEERFSKRSHSPPAHHLIFRGLLEYLWLATVHSHILQKWCWPTSTWQCEASACQGWAGPQSKIPAKCASCTSSQTMSRACGHNSLIAHKLFIHLPPPRSPGRTPSPAFKLVTHTLLSRDTPGNVSRGDGACRWGALRGGGMSGVIWGLRFNSISERVASLILYFSQEGL